MVTEFLDKETDPEPPLMSKYFCSVDKETDPEFLSPTVFGNWGRNHFFAFVSSSFILSFLGKLKFTWYLTRLSFVTRHLLHFSTLHKGPSLAATMKKTGN